MNLVEPRDPKGSRLLSLRILNTIEDSDLSFRDIAIVFIAQLRNHMITNEASFEEWVAVHDLLMRVVDGSIVQPGLVNPLQFKFNTPEN